MGRSMLGALLIVTVAATLGATVFREDVAAAAGNLTVLVTNDAEHPVPVHEQGTAQVTVMNSSLAVNAGYETQLLLDQVMSNGQRVTIPVATYKTVHVDFRIDSGGCAGSFSSLTVVEGATFLNRGHIDAADACVGGFTGQTIEMPGRSLTFIVSAPPGDTWRVVAFGRAN